MTNIDSLIREKIESFVEELANLVRQAAVQSVTEAFGAPVPSGGRRGSGRAARGATRAKGEKRTPEALQKMTDDLFAAIKAKPGLRMEQIAATLGTGTKDLALPAKKLAADRKIRTRGQRRATKYFPA